MPSPLSAVALVALLLVAVPSAWGASLVAFLNPEDDEAMFVVSYWQSFTIRHDGEGVLSDILEGQVWEDKRQFLLGDAGVIDLSNRINSGIIEHQSKARVDKLAVSHQTSMRSGTLSSEISFWVKMSGTLTDFVVTKEDPGAPGIIDMGWRHFAVDGPVVLEGIDINTPLASLEKRLPELSSALRETPAAKLLSEGLMSSANFTDPLGIWHFLVDPTGISRDTIEHFGISESFADKVISKYTLGAHSMLESHTPEIIFMPFTLDRDYAIYTEKLDDIGEIFIVGYTRTHSLDGLEELAFSKNPIYTPDPPKPDGQFRVLAVYVITVLFAIGLGLITIRGRLLKKRPTHAD